MVLVHSLIILWDLDDLRSRTVNSKSFKPFVGEVTDSFTSYFIATWRIYFLFLTCKVKCSAQALDIADQQNAYSMTLAVRGVVEFFRLLKRETELY
jgi:hypothetical protein